MSTIDDRNESRRWLDTAREWFANSEDTEAPQCAQAAALIALTHAVLDVADELNRARGDRL